MSVKITEADLKAALPDVTTTMRFVGIRKPVEVYRDRWGIPHIKAENENDLFFAQGFVTAQDRLWHMDADRYRALGRWAEFVGPTGVTQDRLLRAAGMGRTAKLDYEIASPELTVIGHAVPGMPGALHFCHNEHVAWGMTHGGADTQDLFIERFREAPNGREYLFKDEWRSAEVLDETIEVHGAEAVPLEVTITHHGPVVAGNPASGAGIAISDPGLITGSIWVDAARDAMRSRSVDELHEAFRNWTDRVNNYAVADVHGNFGYLHEGKIPIRPESNGWRAVPGWTGEYEWNGYIPHDELPKAINPDTGYAITCNQRVAGHDYPYYVGLSFTPEYRARRVQTQILSLAPGTATVDDMARIHAERVSNPARVFTEALIRIVPLDDDSEEALGLLRTWNYSMDRDQPQPLIYSKTKTYVIRFLLDHLMGDMAAEIFSGAAGSDAHARQIVVRMNQELEGGDSSLLPHGHDWSDVLTAALRSAVTDLKAQLGDDMSKWKWGQLHRTRSQHPLSVVFPEFAELLDPLSVPTHGDGDTPLAGSYALHNEFIATGMSVNRYIHDPSDWTNSRWIVPLGASGHPGSSHYADQAEMWANVEYLPQLWDWNQISAEAESYQRIEPVESG